MSVEQQSLEGKIDIKSLELEELTGQLAQMGQPKFRGGQVYSWLHEKRVDSFEQMSNLPAALRQHTDGYRLYADGSSIIMQAASPRGILYAWQEWKRRGHIAAGFFKEEVPSRSFRAIHIDLRYGFWHRERR